MKKVVLFVICIILLMSIGVCSAENLFIMGWDAAGKTNVDRLLREGKLPNLQALINSGVCYMPLEGLGYTITVPNWGMLFTGLSPDQSGIMGNKKYVPGTPLDSTYYWDYYLTPAFNLWLYVIPYQYTIVKAIDNRGHKIGWFTSKEFLGNSTNSSPLANIAISADSFHCEYPDSNPNYINVIGQMAYDFISANTDYFVFLHSNPDYYGHTYGENSTQYENEFIRSDAWLGTIMSIVNRNNTKVIVMSDHGFDEGTTNHYNAPDLFWATDLPVKSIYCSGDAVATVRDIPISILEYYNIDWKSLTPRLRGKSLK